MSHNIIDDPNEQRGMIRRKNRAVRSSLSKEEVTKKSHNLVLKLEQLPALTEADIIMGFMPFDNEVDILPFLKAQYDKGKTVLLPRMNQAEEIEGVAYHDQCRWKRNRFGIHEPSGESFPYEQIQSVIVPGLAFDPSGYRLGFGKGYYDRLLARLGPAVFLCGVCYEFQIVDNIFPHAGDIPMHWVVTDHSEILVDQSFF